MRKITIAIDGYSSCGKSTLAKALAARLGYAYVDSGAMYRAVTLYCLEKGLIKDHAFDEAMIVRELDNINVEFRYNNQLKGSETFLNGENVERKIREMEVSNNVSFISVIRDVRTNMVRFQRELGKDKGVVMDGRDIGTNVFPDAELKLFMTADVEVRVQRRLYEMMSKGYHVTFEEVKNNLLQRDHEDTHRKENPLIKADDAVVLDNSDLDKEEQLEFVLTLINDMKVPVS